MHKRRSEEIREEECDVTAVGINYTPIKMLCFLLPLHLLVYASVALRHAELGYVEPCWDMVGWLGMVAILGILQSQLSTHGRIAAVP